jgi:hypothetical protein
MVFWFAKWNACRVQAARLAAPVEVALISCVPVKARIGRSGIIDEFVTADRDVGLYDCLVDFGSPSRI